MKRDGWQEQLRRGGLDLAILATVAAGPRYGLEIIRHLKERSELVITEGTVYPILGRLAREGVLLAEWVHDEAPHPRKYYRLSSSGRTALAEMAEYWQRFAKGIAHLLRDAEGGRS